MAEDFQPSNDWWNNSRSSGFNGSQAINSPSAPSLSSSTTISDGFSWLSANEISESKPRLCDNQIDDSLHFSGLGFSTISTDWNQTLLCGEKTGSSFQTMHQEDISTTRPFFRKELGESSMTIPFKDMNYCTSSSASSSYVYSSSILPCLIEQDKRFQQPFFDSQQMADKYRSQMMDCHGFSNEKLEPSGNQLPQLFKDFSHKQQSDINQLQFTNNIPFWNVSAESCPSALPSSGIQLFESKPDCSMTVKSSEEVSEKKTSNESELKKPRIETLSPLPTALKVRKEKLGDRITALQQLVSPFGKTATASVLHETIEYIKYLHDQVSVLSTPYLRATRPMQQEKKLDKSKDGEEPRQDLRSRGLCLVPITSTYTMTSDQATSDFWTPTPGRTSW